MAKKRRGPKTRRGKSRQKKHGGGKFGSERQRRWMWAKNPKAAKKWAHSKKTSKSDWKSRKGSRRRKKGSTKKRRRSKRRRR